MALNLHGHTRVGIDSNIFIYVFDGTGELADSAASLLDEIGSGGAHGVMASLALTEICTRPAREGQMALVERYADEIVSMESLHLVPLTADLAVDAAIIRGSRSVSLADAIHLASARAAQATAFVTNDRRIKSSPQLEVLYLDEL